MKTENSNIVIYQTQDGKAAVSLMAQDGNVWMNQSQLAELFATSVPNISMHIANILGDKELQENSVVKDYLTTCRDFRTVRLFSALFTALKADFILSVVFA